MGVVLNYKRRECEYCTELKWIEFRLGQNCLPIIAHNFQTISGQTTAHQNLGTMHNILHNGTKNAKGGQKIVNWNLEISSTHYLAVETQRESAVCINYKAPKVIVKNHSHLFSVKSNKLYEENISKN